MLNLGSQRYRVFGRKGSYPLDTFGLQESWPFKTEPPQPPVRVSPPRPSDLGAGPPNPELTATRRRCGQSASRKPRVAASEPVNDSSAARRSPPWPRGCPEPPVSAPLGKASGAPAARGPPRSPRPLPRCPSAAGAMGSEQSAEAESRPGDLNASGRCLTSRPGAAGGAGGPTAGRTTEKAWPPPSPGSLNPHAPLRPDL